MPERCGVHRDLGAFRTALADGRPIPPSGEEGGAAQAASRLSQMWTAFKGEKPLKATDEYVAV